ncbi:MAG TPA: hypothetical protein VJ793_05720 [Anaerolineae bacterium]|nr:hypothetical protein [Anaerolineae bacterium]
MPEGIYISLADETSSLTVDGSLELFAKLLNTWRGISPADPPLPHIVWFLAEIGARELVRRVVARPVEVERERDA